MNVYISIVQKVSIEKTHSTTHIVNFHETSC